MLTMRVRNDKKAAIISEKLAAVTPAEMSAYAAAVNAASVDTAKFVTFSSPSISGLGYEPAVAGVAPSMEKVKFRLLSKAIVVYMYCKLLMSTSRQNLMMKLLK